MGRFKLLALPLLIISCDNTESINKKKYDYQGDCYHCHGIKSKVISYALNSSLPFYFIRINGDEEYESTTKEETIGKSYYLYSFSGMTPQLSYISNKVVVIYCKAIYELQR